MSGQAPQAWRRSAPDGPLMDAEYRWEPYRTPGLVRSGGPERVTHEPDNSDYVHRPVGFAPPQAAAPAGPAPGPDEEPADDGEERYWREWDGDQS